MALNLPIPGMQDSGTFLKGKVVVVVGASSGIGEGCARAIAKSDPGVILILCARRVDRLEATLKEITGPDGADESSKAVALDVTKRDDVRQLFETDLKAWFPARGGADVLVNTAGVMYFTLLKNGHWDEWEQQVDVNCKGTVNVCGAALPAMLARKAGHFVNISSDAAITTFPALSVYNASKAFVHEYTKGLRCECVGTGVRVTEIQPGDVRTDLIAKNSDADAAGKIGVTIGGKIGGEDWEGAVKADPEVRNSYLDVGDIASAVLFALKAPAHMGVHEMLLEPRNQMWGDPTSTNA